MSVVAVTGGRDYRDIDRVFAELRAIHTSDRGPITKLIQGGAKGADRIAVAWADNHMIEVVTYPADWELYGRMAGPIRNREMLDDGKPDVLVAFPGGKGTASCVREARKLGIEVIEVAS